MIDWNEDNFLERLTPQLRRKAGAAKGPCPDAEALCAVVEGVAREPERDTIIKHLAQCSACADLRNRLLDFEGGGPPQPEAVWVQTRTRLDNWLEGFLRSEAARVRSPKHDKPTTRASIGESILNFFTPRKIIWALSVALVFAVIVDGALLLEYKREHLPQVQVAVRPTAPPEPPANAVPAQNPPAQGTETPKLTPREEGLPKVGENSPARAENPNRPKAGESKAPAAPALPSASPDHNPLGMTARAVLPSRPKPAAGAGADPTSRPSNGSTADCPTCIRIFPSPLAPAQHAVGAPISPPPTLSLDPAGRLLVVLSSISPKPDGSFQFHGILLLPVAHLGPIPLDRGAQVIGVGTGSQDQISLAVTDLVIQGVRYTLKEGSGAMNAQTPGTGGGVHFERSQVLDMSPKATAVYEKVTDQTAQPEPQK